MHLLLFDAEAGWMVPGGVGRSGTTGVPLLSYWLVFGLAIKVFVAWLGSAEPGMNELLQLLRKSHHPIPLPGKRVTLFPPIERPLVPRGHWMGWIPDLYRSLGGVGETHELSSLDLGLGAVCLILRPKF